MDATQRASAGGKRTGHAGASAGAEPERLRSVFERACQAEVKEDGVTYDAESLRVAPVREGAEYDGLRAKLTAYIGSARLRLQIDVGFGDAATPAPRREEFPTLLEDFPVPVVKTYRPETVVAEKLHGMAKLGLANSRMKDYYDVWHLSQRYELDSASLARAIRRTFERLPRAGAGTEAWWQAAEKRAKRAGVKQLSHAPRSRF